MKSIKSKLLIYVGLIVLIFSTILFYRTYTLITDNYENLTNQQLSLALNFDLAIREYVAEKIRPLMFNLLPEGRFIPQTMSTSFVARNIFNKVRNKFPDYIIKFSADNPRNPVNLAGPEELNMIKYFNENPQEKVWTGEINLANKSYFAKFSAMRIEESCLRCHGNPADAPAELLEIYGSQASFYLPLGKVVGLDTIAIPKEKVTALFFNEAINNFTLLGTGLLFLCISLVVIFKFVIISIQMVRCNVCDYRYMWIKIQAIIKLKTANFQDIVWMIFFQNLFCKTVANISGQPNFHFLF